MGSERASPSTPDAIATVPNEAGVFRVGVEDAATVAIAAVGRLGMPDLSFDGRWLLAPVQVTDGGFVCCRRRWMADRRPRRLRSTSCAPGPARRRRARVRFRSYASSHEARPSGRSRRRAGGRISCRDRGEARRAGVAGWVRNLRDGSVEVEAEGTPEAVDQLDQMAAARAFFGTGDRGGRK